MTESVQEAASEARSHAEKYRVVLTDQVFPNSEIERGLIEQSGGVLEVASGCRDEVLAAIRDADAILTTYFPLSRSDIEKLERCRIIARYGIGVDNVDVVAALERGIAVTNVPDYCVDEVATHALALALSMLRRLPTAHAEVLAGRWGLERLRPMLRPSEVTFGIVGYGRIARRVAAGARALGMRILVHDPYLSAPPPDAELVDLQNLLQRSDVVSLHCPLTDETNGLIGTAEIALMQPHAVLVNTSRGSLIRFHDLLAALRREEIGGAGLDVVDPEPVDPAEIADLPNLIITPHIAYYSESALRESQLKAATQVVKVMTGHLPDYPVTRPAADAFRSLRSISSSS